MRFKGAIPEGIHVALNWENDGGGNEIFRSERVWLFGETGLKDVGEREGEKRRRPQKEE